MAIYHGTTKVAGGTTPTFITTDSISETNEYVDNKRVYVKRLTFGALLNNSLKSVAHGLDMSTRTLVRLEGIAKATTGIQFTLPYSNSATIANNISLYIDGTNVNIATGADRTSFTETFIYIYFYNN